MLETDLLELQGYYFFDWLGTNRLRIARSIEDLLKILQGNFCFAIYVDDISQFLQRSEDEERIDHQRKELSDRNLLAEDQVKHQEQYAGAKRVDGGPLDETEAPQILHLLEFKLENFLRDSIESHHFLMSKPEALHQFNVAQRLRGRTRERGSFADDRFLYLLDLSAQNRTDHTEQRNRDKECGSNRPVNPKGVNHHEHHADERSENHVDGSSNKLFYIAANLLQLA